MNPKENYHVVNETKKVNILDGVKPTKLVPMETKIIVNADDLGISDAVNNAIFRLIEDGRVTSATLLANGDAIEDAVRRSSIYPQASFGVHLNASEFRPITTSQGLTPILSVDGFFLPNRLREIRVGSELREALFNEWSAQVQKLINMGVQVSHFDSHHHIHTIPALFPVLKKLQHHFRVNKVRNSLNIYPENDRISLPINIKKKLWNAGLRYLKFTKTTSAFTSLNFLLLNPLLLKNQFSSIEVMVHPGHPFYERETEMLLHQWEIFLPFKVKLINYFDL